MRQFGLTFIALVLIVTPVISAHAASEATKAKSVSTSAQFTPVAVSGNNVCCR